MPPRIRVVLSDGHEVLVDGANTAEWITLPLVSGAGGDASRTTFEVRHESQDGGDRRILARFDSAKVLGYVRESY